MISVFVVCGSFIFNTQTPGFTRHCKYSTQDAKYLKNVIMKKIRNIIQTAF